jgi:hypothetical protein
MSADAFLRRGNDAAARGAWAEAARLYEQAEPWAEEPGLVAFNLATARYHLAEAGEWKELAGAEACYRACLDGPRRGRALVGLGNCLVLRALVPGSIDAVALRDAIDRYDESLRESGNHRATARHNRERARLLLLQAVSRPDGASESGEGSPDDTKDDPPPSGAGKDEGDVRSGTEPVPVKGKGAEKKGPDDLGKGSAGKGVLPPVPDSENAPPIGKADAAAHLSGAARRIIEEWRAYRRSLSKPAASGRDW